MHQPHALNVELRPLAPKESVRPFRFSVADIETADWTRFLVLGFFNGREYRTFQRLGDFLRHLQKNAHPDPVFFHFGGGFDFMFVIQACLDHGWDVHDLIPRGSLLLMFKATSPDGSYAVEFRDSNAFLPDSLRRLTEGFGIAHRKLEIDYTKIRKVTPKLLEYLEHDCKGLYEVIETYSRLPMIQKSGMAFTTASQAMRVLRTYLTEPLPSISGGEEAFVRRGYCGGRTEIFRQLFEGPGELHCYDVNSLFPAAMENLEVPGEAVCYSRKYDSQTPGFYDLTVECPPMHLPFLPKMFHGKRIFPTGTFRGTYSVPEIEYALTLGYKILKVHEGLKFNSAGRPFQAFVREMYAFRMKHASGTPLNTFGKLMLNSCYGRFAFRRDKTALVFDEGQPGFEEKWEIRTKRGLMRLGEEPNYLDKSYSHVGIGAYITAESRIRMHRLMSPLKNDLFYTDTDSIFTTQTLPTGKGLGELKLEYSLKRACFLLPKTYRGEYSTTEKGGFKIAMKGFPKGEIQHFTHEDFEASLRGELERLKVKIKPRFAKFKTAIAQGEWVGMTKPTQKTVLAKYDKRRVYLENNAWLSRPIRLKLKEKNR